MLTMQCPDCNGTGQKINMRPVRLGVPLPPFKPCPRCDGAGEVPYPKPARVRPKRRSLRRVR
jgi:DnaJ-class molecular chaperone